MTLSNNGSIQNNSPIAQVIPGRLYFTSYAGLAPKNDAKTVYISIDDQVHYDAFYDDFGPLNLAVLYRFCQSLNSLLQTQRPNKMIFLYTNMCPKNRVNAVFIIASYMIIYQNLTAEQAYLRLQTAEPPVFIGFRDAAMGPPSYLLHVQHVIQGIAKAVKFKWLDFDNFDPDEYEFFERVENGDLNWIIPGKILSFCGPHERSYIENGYPYHSPEVYFDYFRTNNVTTIIRLNKKIYDAKRFTEAGFDHHDLFFIDGSTPSDEIIEQFIQIVDCAKGAVAIHCKAGLGRTGTLIACWMMKHFRLTAPQCMGWLRVCRPGSVIGPQQHFLIEKQSWCWRMGREEMPTKEEADNSAVKGKAEVERKSSIIKEAMEAETAIDEAGRTQGDRLCQIKANRQQRMLTNRHLVRRNEALPGSSSPPAFVSPSALERHQQYARAAEPACHYSSATTPIKQLKLMSTTAGINRTTNQKQHHAIPTADIQTKPTELLIRNLRNKEKNSRQHGGSDAAATKLEQRNNNNDKNVGTGGGTASTRRTAISKIPIQKVSVSSSDNLASKNGLRGGNGSSHHRKHLSNYRLVKPYMPGSHHQPFNEHIMAPSTTPTLTNDRALGQRMGGGTKPDDSRFASATTYFGRALNRQYARINANPGGLQQSTSSSQIQSASGELQAQFNSSPTDGHQTKSKYELRPRSQLHLPTRYLAAADFSSGTTTILGCSSQSTSPQPCKTAATGTTSPFAFSRNHKASRSSTAILSSRL